MSATAGQYMTVAEYAPLWLRSVDVATNTLISWESTCRVHIIPLLGRMRLGQIEPYHIQMWKSQQKGARSTIQLRANVLCIMLGQAKRDGLIQTNPATGLRSEKKERRIEEPKAMTAEQLAAFLEAARWGRYYLQFYVLAHTGLRPGEGRGLQASDLDFAGRVVRVRRQVLADGTVAPPKTQAGVRDVDMADEVSIRLKELVLRSGASPWIMFPDFGEDPKKTEAKGFVMRVRLERAMITALKHAKLPDHFTPHCLRHTFATQLLLMGKPATYVQYQLGHASIQETVDTYGSWLPKSDKAAVDDLARLVGSRRQMGLW